MKPVLFLLSLGASLAGGCVVGPYPVYTVRTAAPAPAPGPPPLTQEEVLQMAHAGIADDVIIEKIRSNGLAVHPSSDQLVTLKNQGLSDNVLVALVNARVGPPPAASGSTYDYSYSAYPGYSYPYYYSYPYFYGGWGYAPYAYGWGYWGGHYGCYPHYGYYHGGHVIIHH